MIRSLYRTSDGRVHTDLKPLFLPHSFVVGFSGMNSLQAVALLAVWTGKAAFALTLVLRLLTPTGIYPWAESASKWSILHYCNVYKCGWRRYVSKSVRAGLKAVALVAFLAPLGLAIDRQLGRKGRPRAATCLRGVNHE